MGAVANAKDHHIDSILEIQKTCLKERYTPGFVKLLLEMYPELCYVYYGRVKDGWRPVGYVLARMEGKRCHVISLAILPEFRRTGRATILMLYIESAAGYNYDAEELFLETRESNTAGIEFYKYYHFKIQAHVLDYYGDGETGVLMIKELYE